MPTDRRRLAPRLVAVMAAIVVAGCGTSAPTSAPGASGGPSGPAGASPTLPSFDYWSPSPSAPPEDPAVVYARIAQQVQALRGLTAETAVVPTVLDPTALTDAVRARFDRDNPAARIAAEQRLEQALGLLPKDASLSELELTLLFSQVIGFYEPDTKRMFVLSKTGGLGVLEQIAYAHEFDHALQDQHFDLTKLGLDTVGESDRALARLSLAEGDATILMTDWAQSALTPVQLLQYLQESGSGSQNSVLASMPQYLQQSLLFPYLSGVTFVQGLKNKGGWEAVDSAYASPPDSTEQILHPDKYAAHEPPVDVTIPEDLDARLGGGWKKAEEDTFGEFGIRTWLQVAGGLDADAAATAAAGWGGDQIVLAKRGDGYAAALITTWDTPQDASEFAAAAQQARPKMPGSTALIDSGGTKNVVVLFGSDDAAITRLASALGLAQ